jgi:ribulose-5-phosphate 4-epimerase/fuculose-1-phosphate aldolase
MSSTQTQTATTSSSHVQLQPANSKSSVLNWKIDTTKPLHHIPTFTDKHAERQWAKEHMAAAFRIFARLGWADGASGHISLRDPVTPENFWINPYAVHFAMMKASDLVLVDHKGHPVLPTSHKVNAAGFIIHSSIHRVRPDINVAVHMHSPAGRAWSAFGKGLDMVSQDACMFYRNLAVYENFGGVVLAEEEGVRLAAALGSDKQHLILQNHGWVVSLGSFLTNILTQKP